MAFPNYPDLVTSVSDPDTTGIRLFHKHDPYFDTTVSAAEFNPDIDVHSLIAWAAAMTSRSDLPYEQIFAKAVNNSSGKLKKFFVKYGHASVAGMAPVFGYMKNLPIWLAFQIFNSISVGDGQELSTRFVQLGDVESMGIPSLDKLVDMSHLSEDQQNLLRQKWVNLQKYLVEKYHSWYKRIEQAHLEQFSSQENPVSPSTLRARTLDAARVLIPAGAKTSMALLDSVRMWIDIIIQLRESNDPEAQRLAEHLFDVLNLSDDEDIQMNLGGLTKYAYPRNTVEKNLGGLRDFLLQETTFASDLKIFAEYPNGVGHETQVRANIGEGHPEHTMIAMQYIHVLFPHLDTGRIIEWLTAKEDAFWERFGQIIFANHDNHNLMRNMGDIRGILIELDMSLACIRDLNRHRAFGRVSAMLETKDFRRIIEQGFNKNYQMWNTDCLQPMAAEFDQDLEDYYCMLLDLSDDFAQLLPQEAQRLLIRLLPLGHQATFQMSGPITQLVYMISQRIKGGGDFGYRIAMQKLVEELRQDPFFRHVLAHVDTDVNANDGVQFRDRS